MQAHIYFDSYINTYMYANIYTHTHNTQNKCMHEPAHIYFISEPMFLIISSHLYI